MKSSVNRTPQPLVLRISLIFSLIVLVAPQIALCGNAAPFVPLNTLQLNGSAQLTNSTTITLTNNVDQAGSAFLPTPYNFPAGSSFDAYFAYEVQGPLPANPADGLAFVIANLGPGSASYLGLGGSGLGFFTLTSLPALAVTFDYYYNSLSGTPAGTLGVATSKGSQLAQIIPTNIPVLPGTAASRSVWIQYTDVTRTLQVYYSNTSAKPATPLLSVVLPTTISSSLGGQIYFGITAGTGTYYSVQQLVYFVTDVVAG